MKRQDFINLVTPELSGKFGAPMGRTNKEGDSNLKTTTRKVEMSCCGAYDAGGAYWSIGQTLYVTYSKCGNTVRFHRGK